MLVIMAWGLVLLLIASAMPNQFKIFTLVLWGAPAIGLTWHLADSFCVPDL